MEKKVGMNTGFEGTHRRHDTAIFEKHSLPEGPTVWIQKPPILLTDDGVVIVSFPGVGSMRDPEHAPGAAHFFEHVPFRGTPSFPDIQALTQAIEKRGGGFNGSTYNYLTHYQVVFYEEHFDTALTAAVELATSPLMREGDIALERTVIKSELDRRLSVGASLASFESNKILFEGHPLARLSLGTYESLVNMNKKTLQDFQTKYYTKKNMHVVIGGMYAARKHILREISEKIENISLADGVDLDPFPEPDYTKNGRHRFTNKLYGRDYIELNWLIKPPKDKPRMIKDFFALGLLSAALGQGFDAPLIKILRGDLGLIYETGVTGLSRPSPNIGRFYLHVPVSKENFEKVEGVWTKELAKLSPETVISKQKERQLSRRGIFDDPVGEAITAALDIPFLDRIFSQRENEDLADTVTVEDVMNWRDYLIKTQPFISEVTLE